MFAESQNKLQTVDWNKLLLLWTLANEDTNSRSLQCLQWRELTVLVYVTLKWSQTEQWQQVQEIAISIAL